MPSTLDEALAHPLVEGVLEIDYPLDRERDDRERGVASDPISVNVLPAVTIGTPVAWELSDIVGIAQLAPEIATRMGRESFFLVQLACSFRPRHDDVTIKWARFTVDLQRDSAGNQPLAYDLFPRSVERSRGVRKKMTIAPTLKLLEVEATAGSLGYSVEYTAIDPIVSAAGFQESAPSWDYTGLEGRPLSGGKLMHAVVSAPRALTELSVTISLAADIAYRERRLPAWLPGSSKRRAERIAAATRIWPRVA